MISICIARAVVVVEEGVSLRRLGASDLSSFLVQCDTVAACFRARMRASSVLRSDRPGVASTKKIGLLGPAIMGAVLMVPSITPFALHHCPCCHPIEWPRPGCKLIVENDGGIANTSVLTDIA